MNFSEQILEDIRLRTDIVSLVSEYVLLKKKGTNYYGICPFHTEKTPSFSVSPAKQIWHCFGCHAGGDIYQFLIKIDQLSFPEAVAVLAEKCGVTLPSYQKDSGEHERRSQLLNIYREAHKVLIDNLSSGKDRKGKQYLAERGVSEDMIGKFSLGYLGPEWDKLYRRLKAANFRDDALESCGLFLKRKSGRGCVDRFRGRLIFPICNPRGEVISFGGRTLMEGEQAKYINSPESAIYSKRSNLYALNISKEAIRNSKSAIVVEGYLDCIAAHQFGFANTVATLGTAFTEDHVRLLRRYTAEVALVFDSDKAGTAAAERSFQVFINSDLLVRVVRLKEGMDPDDFLRTQGPERFKEAVEKGENLFDFVLNRAMEEFDLETVTGKMNCLNKVIPLLSSIKNQAKRSVYLQQLKSGLNIEEKILLEELKRAVATGRKISPKSTGQEKAAYRKLDLLFVKLLIHHPELAPAAVGEVPADLLTDEITREIYRAICRLAKIKDTIVPNMIIEKLISPEAKNLSTRLAFEPDEQGDPNLLYADCLRSFQKSRLQSELGGKRARLTAGEADREILISYLETQRKLKLETKLK
ncbi:MAG: DNA primase [bacterium]